MSDDSQATARWLKRLQHGDTRALASLLDYYGPRLRQLISMRMDSRLAARLDPSDVIQDVFFDANRQIAAYLRNPRVEFYVWLRGLAWQRMINLQRHHVATQRRAVAREMPLPAESSVMLLQQLVAGGPTPSRALAVDEMRSVVQHAVQQLKPEDRDVILMRHFEGMTNKEIAQVLEITASGATMRYGRAVFRLKEILQANLTESEVKQ